MLYTVEVRSIGNEVAGLMSNMRTWLDHRRFEPDTFRQITECDDTSFRLEFKNEHEAETFAQAFGGRVMGSPRSEMAAESVRCGVFRGCFRASPATTDHRSHLLVGSVSAGLSNHR